MAQVRPEGGALLQEHAREGRGERRRHPVRVPPPNLGHNRYNHKEPDSFQRNHQAAVLVIELVTQHKNRALNVTKELRVTTEMLPTVVVVDQHFIDKYGPISEWSSPDEDEFVDVDDEDFTVCKPVKFADVSGSPSATPAKKQRKA